MWRVIDACTSQVIIVIRYSHATEACWLCIYHGLKGVQFFFFIGKNIPRGLIFLMDQMKKKLYNWEDIYRIWIWSLCDCWKTLYSWRNFHFDIIVNEFHQQLIKYPFCCLLILDIMSIESGRSTIEIRCMRLLEMFNCWERCRVEMKAGLGTSLRNVK